MNNNECIILGIDPGSRITGYGIIHLINTRYSYVTSGCIRVKARAMTERLLQIHHELSEIIHQYQPHEVAIEQVFMSQNPSSALKLGQARGAAIVAIKPSIILSEYSPRQIKQAVVGTGAAKKDQVQEMVQVLLKLSGKPQADAADALAIAICHAHSRKNISMFRTRKKKVGRFRGFR